MPRSIKLTEDQEKKVKMTKLILIDELDYLYTKDQSVLYNIFDWPHLKNVNPKLTPSQT